MRRGDVVLAAQGKPRPAVIVQADDLSTPEMILICPLTSFLVEAPIYRLSISPASSNGLLTESQLMVDRTGPARRGHIQGIVGRLTDDDMERLTAALAIILDLTG